MATSAFMIPVVSPKCMGGASSMSRTARHSLKPSAVNNFSRSTAMRYGSGYRRRATPGKAFATIMIDRGVDKAALPTWADFEMGRASVFWQTASGEAPASGELLTIFFNPAASKLVAMTEYGIGFNGGFNQPIMCGGEPRIMTRKDRGITDEPLYIIKINVPEHAVSLEFSFTDGLNWDGPYKLNFVVPSKWRDQPISFFNEGLAQTLSAEGACASAIYPEPTFVQDRCSFPHNLIIEGGNRCDLDLVPGCTDPENPFFDPLANVEDGSCPYLSDSDTEA